MNIDAQKLKLRQIFKSKRLELSELEAKKRSSQISENFFQNLLPQIYQDSQKTFSLYLASKNEVNCELIAQHFQKNHIKFSYPKIIAPNQPLEFIATQKNQKFLPSTLYKQILEPVSGEKIFPDFLILPLLAFDRSLSRLGMGGGFFDRTIEFLKNQNSEIITIGLAYDFQRARENIPVENTDQKLDFIVTEKTIFSAS